MGDEKEEDKDKEEKEEKEGKGEEAKGPPEDALKYGPNSCISIFKTGDSDHCIIQTQCKGQDVSKYMFGLLCDSKKEGMVRHLFGEGSFAAEETFDTLIPCDKCLAMDAPPDTDLSEEVKSLKQEVKDIKEGVKELD